MDRKLHIVFGSGPVGLAVVAALRARGQEVQVVNRSGRAPVPAGVVVRAGDATDPQVTAALCQGAAVVYNCTNAPYTAWPEQFPPLQAGVLAGATAAGARLVVMENVYMYGPTGGTPMTEDHPLDATTRKGRVRAQMSRDLLAAHRRGDLPVAIGRAADFYGPGVRDSAMGSRVFEAALAGKAAPIMGRAALPHTYTYIPDIGESLVRLGEQDAAFGQVWHLPSARTVTTQEFLAQVYAAAGQPLRIQTTPRLLVQALGLVNPLMRELAEMLYEFEEPFILDDSRFVQAFGNPATPLETAIAATVAWYRAQAADPRRAAADRLSSRT